MDRSVVAEGNKTQQIRMQNFIGGLAQRRSGSSTGGR
jgi:hypothetical protein